MSERFSMAAAGVPFDGPHLLLVRPTYGARKWALPGGVVEPTETLSEAVRREMLEEVGPPVRVRGLLGVRHRGPEKPGDGNDACFVFVVDAEDFSALAPDPREVADARFFTADGVRTMPAEEIHSFVRTIAPAAFGSRDRGLPDLGNPTSWRGGCEMYLPRPD